jgi:hypothetical protein
MDAVLRFVERGLGVAIVPAIGTPAIATRVMEQTISATARDFAARAGETLRLV